MTKVTFFYKAKIRERSKKENPQILKSISAASLISQMDLFTTIPPYIFSKTKNKIDGAENRCAEKLFSLFSRVRSEFGD